MTAQLPRANHANRHASPPTAHRRWLLAIIAALAAHTALGMNLVRVETRTDEAVAEFGVSGDDTPGRVMVIPSGDEGSLANHAGGDYDSLGETVIGISKASTAFAVMSAWYTGTQPAEVTVTFDDGTTVGPVAPGGTASADGITIINYLPGTEFYPWTSTSGDGALWATFRGNLPFGSEGLYTRFGGTSGSAPIVVGTVALMLEIDADLTASDVRQILRQTAIEDANTGTTPNAAWGFGKVDVFEAVQSVVVEIFSDGFESGDTSSWSQTTP